MEIQLGLATVADRICHHPLYVSGDLLKRTASASPVSVVGSSHLSLSGLRVADIHFRTWPPLLNNTTKNHSPFHGCQHVNKSNHGDYGQCSKNANHTPLSFGSAAFNTLSTHALIFKPRTEQNTLILPCSSGVTSIFFVFSIPIHIFDFDLEWEKVRKRRKKLFYPEFPSQRRFQRYLWIWRGELLQKFNSQAGKTVSSTVVLTLNEPPENNLKDEIDSEKLYSNTQWGCDSQHFGCTLPTLIILLRQCRFIPIQRAALDGRVAQGQEKRSAIH